MDVLLLIAKDRHVDHVILLREKGVHPTWSRAATARSQIRGFEVPRVLACTIFYGEPL